MHREREDKHAHTEAKYMHIEREDKHMQRDGERHTHEHRERGGEGGWDVMVLTHPTDCYCYLKPSTNTLKTSFHSYQLSKIFHTPKQLMLMTLENLEKVGSEFTAVSILFQVQDSPVSMHHQWVPCG